MNLTQGLHRALQQHPDKIAVICGERRRSFRELHARVMRLAGALRALGMRPGDRVAMLALNSDRYLEYQLGVLWGGGVLAPLNNRWTTAEIAYALNDSGTRILIADDGLLAAAEEIRGDTPGLEHLIHAGDAPAPGSLLGFDELIEIGEPAPDSHRARDDLAGIFYTGGSTGFPKGVMLSHSNLWCSAMSALAAGVAPRGSTYLHAAAMFHMADFGLTIPQWIHGNTHVIVPAFDPATLLDTIAENGVNEVLLVPTMIQQLIDHPASRKPRELGCLQRVIYGASPLAEATLDRAMALLPGTEFMQGYGMTELAPLATLLGAKYHTLAGRLVGKVRSAGRAVACAELKIVDAFNAEVARGTVGEVIVRGPNVMLGYWDNPTLSAAAVRDGWMHSGDAAWMDAEGFVYVVDRLKDMIKTGGENVFSTEVENALAMHPAVAASAVIAIPDRVWGEAVHAFVVLHPGARAGAEELRAFCRTRIAGYKCPRSIEFRSSLPLSGAGKVLKTMLREPFWVGKDRRIG